MLANNYAYFKLKSNACDGKQTREEGFTLIELVVGIVIFAIAMVVVISFLLPQVKQGIDPIWQSRAASLGQSLMNEILAKSFDQNSNQVGGINRCNESIGAPVPVLVPCTLSSELGPDAGEDRGTFNDVDDYHGFNASGADILNSLSLTTSVNGVNIYADFRAQVSVFYDQNVDGVNDDDLNQDGSLDSGTLVANKKLVTVIITTPSGDLITFSSLSGNY